MPARLRHSSPGAHELNSTAVTATLKEPARRLAWSAVGANVWYLGATSLLTDASSEMVTSILPVFVLVNLHATPIAFGNVDGMYQGIAAIVRSAGSYLADRTRAYKAVAITGYAFSAICKLGLLVVGSAWPPLAAVIVGDRLGKGLRTAPRDALISMSAPRARGATAFGVHRALDAAGAMIGPIVAFALLARAPGRFDLVFVTSFWVAIVGLAVLVLLSMARHHQVSRRGLPSARCEPRSVCSRCRASESSSSSRARWRS